MYELWRGGTDGADELADAQDWTAPNTCHTQNKELEKYPFQSLEKENKSMQHKQYKIPWTAPNTCHTQNKELEKYPFQSLEKENKSMQHKQYKIPWTAPNTCHTQNKELEK